MEMINNFTGKSLTYSRVTLFILFTMMSFNWYSSSDKTPGNITTIVNLIGGVSFLAWVYAVGHRANDRLQKRNINLAIFKYFNIGFLLIISSLLFMFFLSGEEVTLGEKSTNLNYQITYTQPGAIALVFLASLIFTVVIASKALVSVEKNKEAEFGDYFLTLLLFAFSWIGLWFIQPRIQKI